MKLGQPMPAFEGKMLYERYDRKNAAVTCVLFWSVSCTQCEDAFAVMREVVAHYESIRVLAVHMPRSEEDRALHKIKVKYEQLKLRVPLYIDDDLTVTRRFGNRFVPAIYVFNRDGLRFAQAGSLPRRFLLHRLEKILKM